MSTFIIVGHPGSAYRAVEKLLREHGMASALPSRREKLGPVAISSLLCRASCCKPLRSTDGAKGLRTVQPDGVWNELPLDLYLGQAGQACWGWADPQAIHLLDYWCSLDDELRFVLVYDRPETAFSAACMAGEPLGATGDHTHAHTAGQGGPEGGSELGHVALAGKELPLLTWAKASAADMQAAWYAYNKTLLRFFLRQRQRCVLVHGQSVQRLLDGARDGGGWQEGYEALLGLIGSFSQANSSAIHSCRTEPPQDEGAGAAAALPVSLLTSYLAVQFPLLARMYHDLQSAADWPEQTDQREMKPEVALFDAWRQVEIWRALEKEHARLQSTYARMSDENDLLIRQLHRVQEELEKFHLKYRKSKIRTADAGSRGKSRSRGAPVMKSTRSRALVGERRLGARVTRLFKSRRQAARLAASDLFDDAWYLRRNPDIARDRRFLHNPALHYLLHGGYEGRDPSPRFSSNAYLRKYPDVQESGMNPLLHYVCHGKAEGRTL